MKRALLPLIFAALIGTGFIGALTRVNWSQVDPATTPTTLAGYGITNGLTVAESYAISTFTATALQTDFTPAWSPVTSDTAEVFVGGTNQRLGVANDYTVTVGEHVIFNTGLPLDTPVVIQRR